MAAHVHFNDFEISAQTGVLITARGIHNVPKRDVSRFHISDTDKDVTTKAEFTGREIIIEGIIGNTSRGAMETTKRTIMANIQDIEGRLELDEAGALTRYICTLETAEWTDMAGGYIAFALKFIAADPLGYDPQTTTLVNAATITGTGVNTAMTVGGGYKAEPLITLTLNSGTSLVGNITISNPATGEAIVVDRLAWTAADVLVIDCLNKTVTLNGAAISYTGTFPYWEVGSQNIRYADEFSTRNVTLTVTYQRRWL